ncbi:MAG: orotidine-5'-phosphate decarboxylase [Gemmatimonadaceae bacterium]
MTPIPIVALDVSDIHNALLLTDELGDACTFYKVGSELFTSAGRDVVTRIRDRGCSVFLDLKFHDIPNTVRSAARAARDMGAELITVHASGGAAMISAAVEGASPGCRVLAVTVLTSLDAGALQSVWGKPESIVADEVARLATIASDAGAYGVVCSGHEVEAVHRVADGRLATLVPGIRFADGDAHDQRRIVTPGMAAQLGATYLVVGRAVTGAQSPKAAMKRLHDELQGAVEPR